MSRSSGKKELTPTERSAIWALHEAGYSERQIAKLRKIGRTTVHKQIARKEQFGTFDSLPRSGRPRCTDSMTDRLIKREAVKNPFATAKSIANALHNDSFRTPGVHTVRRILSHKYGMKSHRPAKKPKLTSNQKAKRLRFCRAVESWTVDDWSRVLFSDESTVCCNNYANRVRRPRGERYNESYTVGTTKFPSRIMVWGCMGWNGLGSMWIVPKGSTITKEVYIEVLRDHVRPSMEALDCSIFEQDNATVHTAATAFNWLADNAIATLDWPPNSPDLSCIENLWKDLKVEVLSTSDRGVLSPTRANLEEAATYVWNSGNLTLERCRELIRSMPDRIKECLRQRGGMTRY